MRIKTKREAEKRISIIEKEIEKLNFEKEDLEEAIIEGVFKV